MKTIFLLLLFFFPGIALRISLRRGAFSYAELLAVSLIFWLMNAVIWRTFGMPVNHIGLMMFLEAATVLFAIGAVARKGLASDFRSGRVSSLLTRSWFQLISAYRGLWIILSILITYLQFVGPYTEVPADFWEHLGRINEEYRFLVKAGHVNDLGLGGFLSGHFFSEAGRYWYLIVAALCFLLQATPYDLIIPIVNCLSVIFISGIYFFYRNVLLSMRTPHFQTEIIASCSAIIFVLTFGKDIFSFFRYYTLAPVFLNWLIFLNSSFLCAEYFSGKVLRRRHWLVLGISVIAMWLMHRQELVFLLVLLALFSSLAMLFAFAPRFSAWTLQNWNVPPTSTPKVRRVSGLILAGATLACLNAWWFNEVRAIHPSLVRGIFGSSDFFMLNLQSQFLASVGIVGLTTLFLYWLNVRRSNSHLLLLSSALAVFVTILNPLFVSTFVRLNDSYTVWRFAFLQLTPLLFSTLLIQSLYDVFYCGKSALLRLRVRPVITILCLVTSISVEIASLSAPQAVSKMPSLLSINSENTEQNMSDLIAFLNSVDGNVQVLTDPVTAYVLRAASKVETFSNKYSENEAHSIKRKKYGRASFNEHKGWFLVVNRRYDSASVNGRLASHWPADITKTTKFYSAEFLQWVEHATFSAAEAVSGQQTTGLVLLWVSDGIAVYRIT